VSPTRPISFSSGTKSECNIPKIKVPATEGGVYRQETMATNDTIFGSLNPESRGG
jgi:hypothetical protein